MKRVRTPEPAPERPGQPTEQIDALHKAQKPPEDVSRPLIRERANILDGTESHLQNFNAKLAPTIIPLLHITGIAYFTVTGIQTILGYPPKWVQSLTGSKRG